VINCAFKADEIVRSVKRAREFNTYKGENIYYKEDVAGRIIESIKNIS
jgi:hypothetical protein